MFHAPPAVRRCARRDLAAEALSSREIESLLFTDAEYGALAFRFPRFSDDLLLDWSWGVRASSGERVLVPTSLVGRPPAKGLRLADATSNGCAAHRSPDAAKAGALLEVIERDALLMNWYLGNDLERIDTSVRGAIVLVASSDVGLPVVVGARLTDDGLRLGTAAALSFEDALDHALDELEGQVGPLTSDGSVDLWRHDRGYGPADHLAHYSGEHGRALFERWTTSEPGHTVAALRERWPSSDAPVLPQLLVALEAAGLDVVFVERSLPEVFGPDWTVIRAIVPEAVEMSWGMRYRRTASQRIAEQLASGAVLSSSPHPYA
ncbi:MAG: YcaO-like family protein [Labilithrix sp.]